MSQHHDTVSVTFDRDDRNYSDWNLHSGSGRYWGGPDGVSKLYDYRAPKGLLQEGDQAVVDSPYGTAVVTVRIVNGPSAYRGVKKWVTCKVDRTLEQRRATIAKEVDDLKASIERTVDEAIALHRIELATRLCPDLVKGIELLGSLETELEGMGGR